jgi:transglutaminase-like putative cysteine protease
MKKITTLLLATGFAMGGHAQPGIYSALTIPDSLKKDADMVTREEYIKFTLKDPNSARFEVHNVFTVLNERGKHYLSFSKYSDKFEGLEDAEIKVYDALGVKRNVYTKKEMTTQAYTGSGLVPDGKITYFEVTAPSYPITVEINYTVRHKGLFNYPENYFQVPYNSVQHAKFEVETPADLPIRYKILNCNYQPAITKDGNKVLYQWEVKNLTAFKLERNSGSPVNFLPQVLLGPTRFQLDEYDGDMSSWKNFGEWYSRVYLKTSELKEDRKNFYISLVKDAKSDWQKAEILYNYLQSNMRYVSIQLGIGGLRPFPASFVDDKKYGDCKALSNYLKSALDAVGVKSNVVIIEGSTKPRAVLEDFPIHYFNHVILCIPQPRDSIWLECTSTTLPFAELGPWTENRKAMMVTDQGGVLVNTPVSNYQKNTQTIHTVIEVNADGGAVVNTSYNVIGEERNNLLMGFHDMKDDEKRKSFLTDMTWKNPDALKITSADKTSNPYWIKAAMEYDKVYSFNAGSKLFFEPRLYPIFDEAIPENSKRMRDYHFTCPYQVFDTTVYKFPAGFTLENLPKNKSVAKPFAQYTCTYTWDADSRTLTSVAMLQLKERVIKAADYPALYDFNKQVMADVNEKVVMKRE